nr:MAG TPA: Replicative helicase [Caudoviricetes sp.]
MIESLRKKMNKSIGIKNQQGFTEPEYEFYQPIYESPIVVRDEKSKAYDLAGIPKRYASMSFDWLREHGTFPTENKEAYAIVKAYADNLKYNLDFGKGLILRGPAGTGKTSIAVSVLKRAIDMGKGGMMISMPNLLDNMLTLSKGDNVAFMDYERKLRNIPLLLLDDFGAEYSKSEWVSAKVESIIIDRYNRMKPIVLTTNYSDSWTKDHYSQRIYDRLRGEYEEAIFKGASHR